MVDLYIVVAMLPDGAIGHKGKLPWGHLPSDLRRFRELTLDTGTMIMGYKTYRSILEQRGGPLEKRKHLVITREHRDERPASELVQFVSSPKEAIEQVRANGRKAYVIGGGEIFKTFLPMKEVKRLHVTIVHPNLFEPEPIGDTFFPEIDRGSWRQIGDSSAQRRGKDKLETAPLLYERLPVMLRGIVL